MRFHSEPSWILAALCLTAACGGNEAPEDGKSSAVTYYRDVKPLLDGRCIDCHRDGGIAPFSLTSYESAYPWRTAIRHEVTARNMPPWTAGPGCNEYVGDPTLTDAQIRTVQDWVDGGAAEGNPNAPGAAIAGDSAEEEFHASVRLEMPEAYTPSTQPDEYRCFVLPWPGDAPSYITGLALRPGNTAMVHHSVLTLVEPESVPIFTQKDDDDPGLGYTCFTNGAVVTAAGAKTSLLGALEKPENGRLFPHGTGIAVRPGAAVILQIHYNTLTTGKPESDRTALEFSTSDEVEHPATAAWAMDPQWMIVKDSMHIPAGDPDAWVSANVPALFVGGAPEFDLHWADLHMHTLGSRGELSVVHADGTKECLLRVDQWKFQWQQTFYLKNPVHVGQGDQLYVECHWDNTPGHQYTVDGVPLPMQDVYWGDGSRDEMCLGNFLVTKPPAPDGGGAPAATGDAGATP